MNILRTTVVIAATLVFATAARADGPQDNLPDSVRRIPKLGIEVAPADRQELEAGLTRLRAIIDQLAQKNDPKTTELLPDIEIYWKAVHDALVYREFFAPAELAKARRLLAEGERRAGLLSRGQIPWTTQTGLVARGYHSRIDGSIQPYGLIVPDSYTNQSRHRVDIWFHGRGETLSELNFIDERERQLGVFHPADTIVVHPYGRYCNAFKFAGEVDVLEVLEEVRKRYRVDDDRISVRGFSMGGAACWQFAVHFADRWFAANPGAGFAETPRFLRVFQRETLKPSWYEQKLWHLYDSVDYAVNLAQCPTVAYSGELDSQKQAADVMAEALRKEHIELLHVIGPATKHAYHPASRIEVDNRMANIAARGRERVPKEVHFVTYTLKYNKMDWVTVDALKEHWEKATVSARMTDPHRVEIRTENVAALTLEMPPGWCPFDVTQQVAVIIDGDEIQGPQPYSDRSWYCSLDRQGETWALGARPMPGLRKRHDSQGPIDDAFMDSFLFVRPTGKTQNAAVAAWAKQESDRAIEHWRRQFRGEARVKDDTAVTDQDIASSNLVLWGDPQSNVLLNKVMSQLPIAWKADQIEVGDRKFPSAGHALILIYPNPLNPARYVVLNSGFTYREYDYLNNARQVPKLPDWAVVDLSTPPNSRTPGKIAAADFFGESWELRPPHD